MPSYPPALHRTVVAVDIAGFTAQERTGIPQVTLHGGLYSLLTTAFDEADIGWHAVEHEDRGDGVLVLVSAEVPKITLVDLMPQRLLAGLRRYNVDRSAVGAIRLRMAVHAGDVRIDDHGKVGPAVNHTCRLLDAQPVRDALAESAGPLALVVSDSFYDDVIIVDPAAEPEAYQCISVSVKTTNARAWLRLFGDNGSRNGHPAERRTAKPIDDEFYDVVDALVDVPTMRDEASRRMVLDLLPPDLADEVPHDPRTRQQAVALLRVCLRFDNGLAELVTTVRRLDGDALPVRKFEAIARKWLANHPG